MNNKSVGQDRNSYTDEASSVVVRQFMEYVRGLIERHEPRNEFRTLSVGVEERCCLRCSVTGLWDVWMGLHDGLNFKLGRCRVCELEKTL
jgi:hypothetical protein